MIVAVEISLYPLNDNFEKPVDTFLKLLSVNKNINVEPGKMSSVIIGELSEIMSTLNVAIKEVFNSNQAVFNLKVSNCCPL